MTPKVALTGATGGLGAAITSVLSARGDQVIGVDLDGTDVAADLSTTEGREAALVGIAERAGDSLDGAVAGAGLGPQVSDCALII